MARKRTDPTPSWDDYLKQIYELALDQTPVKTSQIATALKVSPAAVTEMLKRLESEKFVVHRLYRGVTLTAAGRRRALTVLRRHRLWEVFLHQHLGLPWSGIHAHACRLEHATDDQLTEALDQFLGHPLLDPHGDPIPSPDGSVEEIKRVRLTSLDPGRSAVIARCTDQNPELLAYLKSMDLIPDSTVTVLEKAPYSGTLTVEVRGKERVIGVEAARSLIVRSVE
jgi:DtxR family Mn-dependent transcriptional regulator